MESILEKRILMTSPRIRESIFWWFFLSHWGWVTHICVSELTAIGSDNGLSSGRCQAIIWTNAGLLLIGSLETNFSEIVIEIHTVSFKKTQLKVRSVKWRPFCLDLNVLRIHPHSHRGETGWANALVSPSKMADVGARVRAVAVWVGLLKWDYYFATILGTIEQKETLKIPTYIVMRSVRKMARDGLTSIFGWANFVCAPELDRLTRLGMD